MAEKNQGGAATEAGLCHQRGRVPAFMSLYGTAGSATDP